MSIANTRPMQRRPTHPGEMLREDFLPDFGLTVAAARHRCCYISWMWREGLMYYERLCLIF